MSGDDTSGGTPGQASPLRAIVDQALLLSRAPGSLEATSGGIAPSQALGDFVTAGLESLYEATGAGMTVATWLAAALGIEDINQLPSSGPLALSRLLDAAADPIPSRFAVRAMSADEDQEDQTTALRAMELFGTIPDDVPAGPRL